MKDALQISDIDDVRGLRRDDLRFLRYSWGELSELAAGVSDTPHGLVDLLGVLGVQSESGYDVLEHQIG